MIEDHRINTSLISIDENEEDYILYSIFSLISNFFLNNKSYFFNHEFILYARSD